MCSDPYANIGLKSKFFLRILRFYVSWIASWFLANTATFLLKRGFRLGLPLTVGALGMWILDSFQQANHFGCFRIIWIRLIFEACFQTVRKESKLKTQRRNFSQQFLEKAIPKKYRSLFHGDAFKLTNDVKKNRSVCKTWSKKSCRQWV